MSTTYTYEEAYQELQLIVSDIETGQTNIDDLTEKLQRAASLIAICKAKLSASEEEVEKLLLKLTQEEEEEENENDLPTEEE